ncbi:MAG TPA: GNAT family N-acetyltransferase [Vicinamibacterales bacterium]|nr:GNAT family N-acetyltransferase [Vicinamibacterales bacterium]
MLVHPALEHIVVPQFIGVATDNLMLRPLFPAELLALREGDEQFAVESALEPADGLRAMLVSDEVSPAWLERLRAAADRDPWQFGFVVLETMTGVALGMAGFKGPPDDHGVVEIAYGIVPEYRGRGYATEAAGGLVEYASKDERVRRIRAHTLPERNASTSVLAKNGFELLGEVEDPEDGRVWRWERDPDEWAR